MKPPTPFTLGASFWAFWVMVFLGLLLFLGCSTPAAAQCGVTIGVTSAPASVLVGDRGVVTFTLDGPRPLTRVQVLLDGQVAGEVDGAELRDMAALRFSVPRTPKTYNLQLTAQDTQGCVTLTTALRSLAVVNALGPPPTLTCPTSSRVASLTPSTAVLYSPPTTGGIAPVTVACTPPSGTVLPVGGPTTVSCTATDALGRSAGCVFPLTVVAVTPSTTPLTLSCPTGISVVAPGQPQFAIPQPTGGVSPYLTMCDHNPTDAFPLGATTVSCTASDFNGTTGACSFTVTVTAAQ